MRGRHFDVLMHMQVALRASLLSTLVPAKIKLGFDRARARELQWLFTTNRIRPTERQHVMDALFGFAEKFHVYEKLLRWDIPIPQAARDYARARDPGRREDDHHQSLLQPSAAQLAARVLRAGCRLCDQRARPARRAVRRAAARSSRRMGEAIVRNMSERCENTIGQDTLLEFLATLERAVAIVTPDSGPAHMATAVGTPVVGLYAATNPARCGPYLSRQWCVDKYDLAARRLLGKSAVDLPWTTKIERPGVMDLITPDDVTKKLHSVLVALARKEVTRHSRQPAARCDCRDCPPRHPAHHACWSSRATRRRSSAAVSTACRSQQRKS